MAQRTWFIPGGSSGFGREMTEQILERGDHVVGTVRDMSKVTDLLSAIPHRRMYRGATTKRHVRAATSPSPSPSGRYAIALRFISSRSVAEKTSSDFLASYFLR
jgi:NAD(P)-dependent dehydrogenase (short-subunit alcohol dehydrogenase family)